MLEARDKNNIGLLFGCLLTQIILLSGIDVAGEPKMKIRDPLSKQTLMKSNAQLRREDQDDAPLPPHIHVVVPDIGSSSQATPPPPQHDAGYAQILDALAALQGGISSMQLAVSSMQQSISTLQQEVHSINLRVEQSQWDIQKCLKHLHPSSSDDEDDAHMVEAAWYFFGAWCLFILRHFIFHFFGIIG
jgi:hypothetical protein